MPYIVNHIHIKSKDPEKTAKWFVDAFNVKIVQILFALLVIDLSQQLQKEE